MRRILFRSCNQRTNRINHFFFLLFVGFWIWIHYRLYRQLIDMSNDPPKNRTRSSTRDVRRWRTAMQALKDGICTRRLNEGALSALRMPSARMVRTVRPSSTLWSFILSFLTKVASLLRYSRERETY